MFAFSEYDGAALSDETWVDLFPWLDQYESADAARLEELVPEVSDWWIADSPRATVGDTDLDRLVSELARLTVRHHRASRFGDLAPGLNASLPVRALRLEPRAETVVRRLDDRSLVAALLSTTLESLFTLKGTSPDTVQEIAAGVLGASILRDPARGVVPDDEADSPVATQLVDDLRVLARWRGLRGTLEAPLITVEIEDDAPEQVQEAATRISAVTGKDVVGRVESDPVDELENLIEQLDERKSLALGDFVMAREPVTIGELSVRLHVSKSRASSIVAQLRQDMAAACEFGTAAGGLLASMRSEIRPVTTLDRLLDMQPVLRSEVPSLGVPLWLALDRLDDGFEVTGPWAVAPDLRGARSSTLLMLEQFESEHGVVPLAAAATTLRLSTGEVRDWLRYCGVPVLDDSVLVSTRRLVDHAAAILEVKNRPVDLDELVDVLDTDRSERSVARLLAEDERFARTSAGRWTLATSRADVVAPLAAPSPALAAAIDSARDGLAVEVVPRPTRRLYRIGDAWYFRIRVTTEHLRGSGFTIPLGVAQAFGCRPGAVRELASPLGTQMVRWTGTNPTCGTIRRFLVDQEVEPGAIAFLTWSAERGFDVVACSEVPADDPVRRALALIGVDDPGRVPDDELVGLLASAAGLSRGTKPRRILSCYQSRDEAVAELLEAAWTVGAR